MDRYNVVWDTPSEDCYGSMPIGNGDIGLNLWAQDEGGLYFYISKTDAWSENNRLLKLGRVHVGMSPNPFARGKPFKQTLHLRNAEILIEAGEEAERVSLRVWVDANHPVIHVEIEGKSDITLRVDMEMWRTHRREITDRGEKDSGTPPVLIVEPDTVVSDEADRIVWYHRNERSMWEDNMRLTLMDEMIPSSTDPLLHRTFGAAIEGEGLVKAGDLSLVSAQPGRSFSVDIFPLTSQTDTAGQWLDELDRQIEAVRAVPKDTRLAAHRQWWDDFWNRSWIFVTYCWDSFAITQGYALQRFINACGGRGAHPIKFNGSIFTVDAWPDLPRADGTYADADYRRWGGSYWLYNQRIAYYCMFECGDFELLMPFFKMYVDSLELNKHRTRKYHGHDGVSFPEIMHFWGNITTPDYAWEDRESVPERIVNESFYLFWEGGLELATMMIDCFQYTQDRQFAASMMLPLAAEVIKGYDQHWGRDENGTYRLFPACLAETKPDIVNPAPDIAGLKFVLGQLLDLPEDLTTQEQRSEWSRFRGELPELATRELNGLKLLAQAEKMPDPGYQTDGNAGLFAVHPFRLFGGQVLRFHRIVLHMVQLVGFAVRRKV